MIGNRAQRLIGRTIVTAAIVAAMVVLILICVRSGGNGTGAGTATLRANPNRGGDNNEHSGQSTPGASAGSPPSSGQPSEEAGNGGKASGGGPETNGGNASATRKNGSATATYTGPVVQTLYGPVQVAVAEEGGRIVDVQALQVPTDRPQSLYISEQVTPLLREEVLQAQSARINLVSGASYTSTGYAESLQKALGHVH